MTASASATEGPPRSGKKMLLLAGITVLAVAAGFAGSYLGYVPLPAFASRAEDPATENPFAGIEFVDVPAVMVTIPGNPARQVVLAAKLEVDAANRAAVEHMQPRIADTFNTFLSAIDPQAFERRGILDIIRTELATRVEMVLGKGLVRDVLITQFGIR
ncbi:flagellar basal body-associated FliL family protein [Paracoccus pacificus]|uniref:Flagellar protein FliL n=1 Tax=Paracoccus pacificus TaxID=1463598 RepID=A0ABW4RD81_9RHOB